MATERVGQSESGLLGSTLTLFILTFSLSLFYALIYIIQQTFSTSQDDFKQRKPVRKKSLVQQKACMFLFCCLLLFFPSGSWLKSAEDMATSTFEGSMDPTADNQIKLHLFGYHGYLALYSIFTPMRRIKNE